MDRITLQGIRCEGRLGVSEDERSAPQLVEVDIVVEADLALASSSDDLADTVDYGPLVAIATRTVEQGSYALLEGLAGAIAQGVSVTSPRIAAVTVRVRKLAVP